MSTLNHQFIIYACPVGKLNVQLEHYLNRSRELCGENAAHKYMPHCSLTGFFTAELDSIPVYLEVLDKAYNKAENRQESLDIAIKQLTFKENWHGLELQSDRLKKLIADFAGAKTVADRVEKLRLKDWLHLSLAYDFDPKYGKKLQELATATIDLKADVNWELRFYQKNPDWSWKCLKHWS